MKNLGTTIVLRALETRPGRLFAYPDFVVPYLLFFLVGCLIVAAFGGSLYSLNYLLSSQEPTWWAITIIVVSLVLLIATAVIYCTRSEQKERKLLPQLDQIYFNATPKGQKIRKMSQRYGEKFSIISTTEE